ncbi:MAG: ABC transporter substrate-binding protein [Dongiaceae bacterium]
MNAEPPRIVSLLPAATDTILALGAGDCLVGISHECSAPPWRPDIARPSRPGLDPAARSGIIDRDVRRLIEQGLSVYEIDATALNQLKPDVIVTQTQCAVCAVTPEDLAAALAEWVGAAPVLLSLAPTTLSGACEDMRRIANAIGRDAEGCTMLAALTERIEQLAAIGAARDKRPSVAIVEWLDPPMGAGNWMPELVTLAGGDPLFGEAGQHTPFVTVNDIAAADPDILIFAPCGFPLAQTLAELPNVFAMAGWQAIQALSEGRAFAADGNRYFNRPGPGLVDTLAMLVAMLDGRDADGDGFTRIDVAGQAKRWPTAI